MSTDDDLYLCTYSEASHRHGVLADDGLTGILYLHAPSDDPEITGEVEATCFAYNRIDPIDTKDVQNYRPGPPPIAKGYASAEAVCLEPKSNKWQLFFSTDGTAVLLTKDGVPWAITSLNARRGISKAIQAQGPWGDPWSDEFFESINWENV